MDSFATIVIGVIAFAAGFRVRDWVSERWWGYWWDKARIYRKGGKWRVSVRLRRGDIIYPMRPPIIPQPVSTDEWHADAEL